MIGAISMLGKNVYVSISIKNALFLFLIGALAFFCLAGCAESSNQSATDVGQVGSVVFSRVKDCFQKTSEQVIDSAMANAETQQSVETKLQNLNLTKDIRSSFNHGPKGAESQKYIVLHDTEGEGSASGVVDWWDSNGAGVAAHFIINKDGSIVQCVDLDRITHHAGYGDTGHNQKYGTTDELRDDKVGTQSIGSWASDYGMNSYSVGIEMVHVGGSGDYPQAQLEALDNLIAYIDTYYGFESEIIDHKAWRSGNSDTSPEFARYLVNYQDHRSYK